MNYGVVVLCGLFFVSIGGAQSVSSLSSCANVRCSKGTACVETENGPVCVSTAPKPGRCPKFKCELPTTPPFSTHPSCTYDSQCPGNQKCCKDCHGLGICLPPLGLPPCTTVKCPPGFECIVVPVKCYKYTCPSKLLCVNERCVQPAEPGFCKAVIPSWYFNVSTGRCERFIYGGCGGNTNRFSTKEECEKVCLDSIPK